MPAGAALFAGVASLLLIGFWLELIQLGVNSGLERGGWFPFGIVLGELLLVGVITGFVPAARRAIRRVSVYAAMAWLMVGVNLLLFIFVINIY